MSCITMNCDWNCDSPERRFPQLALQFRLLALLSVLVIIVFTIANTANTRGAISTCWSSRFINRQPTTTTNLDVNNIDVGLEQTLQCSLTRVYANRDASEDTREDQSVTRLGDVHKLVINAERDGMGCLAIRDHVWCFLQSDNLTVREFAAVVDEGHRSNRGADVSRAAARFFDFASVNFDLDGVLAGQASEECHLHVWNDGRSANYETLDADEFVGIYKLIRNKICMKNRTDQLGSTLSC